jgi:excisionase family DNA binding protein
VAVTTGKDEGEFPKELAAQLITVTEAAQLSRLTPSFIRRLLRRGDLAGIKIGAGWLTTEAAVRDYLARDRRPGPKPRG